MASNASSVNEGHLGMPNTARTSPLAQQKPNPWFNVLAAVVVVTGIIYAGYHLADDLSVVRIAACLPPYICSACC